jgi:large subunit ribosomal protein L25
MKIGAKKYITEISNDKYKFLHPENTVICQVRRSRVSIEEEEEEEAAAEAAAAAEAEGGDAPATEAAE